MSTGGFSNARLRRMHDVMGFIPPLASGEAASLSLTPHTDSGFMTLLAPNPVPGLSISSKKRAAVHSS